MRESNHSPDDSSADAARLMPIVYDELRKLAAAKLSRERVDHTLNPTALVHEVWLKLGGGSFASESAFLRAGAKAMRRVLVDHARAHNAAKRGRNFEQIPLSEFLNQEPDVDLVSLDEALTDLQLHDPIATELINLRYFLGYGHAQSAEMLGLTRRQADGVWAVARAWLYRRLRTE